MKNILFFVFFLVIFSLPQASLSADYSQDNQLEISTGTQELSGEILSVDPVEKTIVLKYLIDPQKEEFEAELFSLTTDTAITKNGQKMEFSALKVGDRGSLNYMMDSSGKKVIGSLNLN